MGVTNTPTMTNLECMNTELYNLRIDQSSLKRSQAKIGLLRGNTGVPVFYFLIDGLAAPLSLELRSLESLEELRIKYSSSSNTVCFNALQAFFETGGTSAHLALMPWNKEESALTQLLGLDRGLTLRTGIHTLRDFREVCDLVAAPQAATLLSTEERNHFYNELTRLASPHFFTLIDTELTLNVGQIQVPEISSPDAAVFLPWLQWNDVLVPASVMAAVCIQKNDKTRGISQLPVNQPLPQALLPLIQLTPAELGQLTENKMNVFHRFSDGEVRLWSGRTLSQEYAFETQIISLRRTLNAVQEAVSSICEAFVLEPLGDGLSHQVDVAIQSALQPLTAIFSSDKSPFQTDVTVIRKGFDDILNVNLKVSLPYVLEEVSLSLSMAA